MIETLGQIHHSFLLNKAVFILQDNVLHSLFLNDKILKLGELTPLQEVFSFGDLDKDIFSFDFISKRGSQLGYTDSIYINKTIKPLKDVLERQRSMVLYFSKSMSSIINLIVLLAFFEKNDVKEEVNLVLFDERDEDDITIRKISLGKFTNIYNNILVDKKISEMSKLKVDQVFSDALVLYLHYNMDNNEIITFIRSNMDKVSKEELFTLVFDNFKRYGFNKYHIEELLKRV